MNNDAACELLFHTRAVTDGSSITDPGRWERTQVAWLPLSDLRVPMMLLESFNTLKAWGSFALAFLVVRLPHNWRLLISILFSVTLPFHEYIHTSRRWFQPPPLSPVIPSVGSIWLTTHVPLSCSPPSSPEPSKCPKHAIAFVGDLTGQREFRMDRG